MRLKLFFALYWDNSNENAAGQASYLCKISKTKNYPRTNSSFIKTNKESS